MTEAEVSYWLQNSIDQLDLTGMYTKDKFKLIRIKVSIIFLTIYLISGILDLMYNCDDLEKYVECLTTLLPSFATFGFYICFISNRDTLHEVINILRTNFILHHHAIKAEIMGIRLVKYSQLYLYFVIFVYDLMGVQSYIERDGTNNIHDGKANGLPARCYFPIDFTKLHNFILILCMQLFTVIIIVHITIPIAMCFAALLIHLRGQLFYLQECLIEVCESDDPKTQRILLNKALKYHMILIHFTEKMQSAFGIILSIHNYSPSIVISVCGYQASMMSVLNPKFLPYISTVNYVLAECFVYCYYGQHIIDQSEILGFMAYSNKWYNCSPNIRKDLNMIIMRCQNPLRMKFVGSTSASLETYYNIVKTGYSYFMFLAGMGASNET